MRKFEKSCKEKLKSTSTDSEAKEKQGLYINLKTHLWKKISISITAISLYKKIEKKLTKRKYTVKGKNHLIWSSCVLQSKEQMFLRESKHWDGKVDHNLCSRKLNQ